MFKCVDGINRDKISYVIYKEAFLNLFSSQPVLEDEDIYIKTMMQYIYTNTK